MKLTSWIFHVNSALAALSVQTLFMVDSNTCSSYLTAPPGPNAGQNLIQQYLDEALTLAILGSSAVGLAPYNGYQPPPGVSLDTVRAAAGYVKGLFKVASSDINALRQLQSMTKTSMRYVRFVGRFTDAIKSVALLAIFQTVASFLPTGALPANKPWLYCSEANFVEEFPDSLALNKSGLPLLDIQGRQKTVQDEYRTQIQDATDDDGNGPRIVSTSNVVV